VISQAHQIFRGTEYPISNKEFPTDQIFVCLPWIFLVGCWTLFSETSFSGPPAKPVSEPVWVELVRALTTKTSVRINYRGFESRKATPRILQPCHIANLSGDWYVFGAYPETPSDIRQFAMARIRTAELTGETFDMPAGFDPERLLAGAFSRFAGGRPVAIRLLFDREIADWVREREWHPGQTLKTRRNGDVELAFKAAGLYEVSRWILGWGRYARVLAPPALKKMVADEIRAMAKRAR
jgi:predicted DNA-binding transcriptional regulator YafY